MKEAKAKRHLPYWISLRLVPCLVQLGSGLVPLRSAEFQAPVGPVMSGASTTSTVMVPLMVCNGFKGVLNAMHDKSRVIIISIVIISFSGGRKTLGKLLDYIELSDVLVGITT